MAGNFRIKKYDKGFVVEVQMRKWYGKKYWTHFISTAGMSSEPWCPPTYELARQSLIQEIKWQTDWNSRYC